MGISDKKIDMTRLSRSVVNETEKRTRSDGESDQNTEHTPSSRPLPPDVGKGLLDGLPIQHVTKDEWEQMGAFTSPAPTLDHAITYVEQGGKYKETGLASSAPNVRKKLHVILKTPIELAIIVQKLFNTVYLLCHGLLGGLALAHLILVFNVGEGHIDIANFVNVYSSLARLYQALFYVLVLLCMMSTLDRCDLCHFNYLYKLLTVKPLTLMAFLVCGITLILSCHTSYWDHRLSAYYHNNTLLEEGLDVSSQVGIWKTLSTLRCVGGILAWLLITLLPSNDGVTFHLTGIQQLHNSQALF